MDNLVVKRGRNFRLLDADELPKLLDFVSEYLPESLKFQQTLLTYIKDKVWDFYFYVTNDWPSIPVCVHFPGMTLSTHGLMYESVGVFCPGDQLQFLRFLKEEDILIDWAKPLYINFVHCDIADTLLCLYEGTGTVEQVLGDVWACDNPRAALNDDDPDEDPKVQVLPLKAEHAEGIHDLYPANTMESHELFLRLIDSLEAAGVFVDGTLAAWMVQSYYGAMFSMQTKPEYRRKGYGTKLARYLIKRVLERGYNPFVVIRPENDASQSLYTKLGFRRLYQMIRMTFIPYSWTSEESSIFRDNLENCARQHQTLQVEDDLTLTIVECVDDAEDRTIRDQTDSPDELEGIVDDPEDACQHKSSLDQRIQ